jgi:hypothetical protein
MKPLTLRQIKYETIRRTLIRESISHISKHKHYQVYHEYTGNGMSYIISNDWNHLIGYGKWLTCDENTGYFSVYSVNNADGNGRPKIYNEKGILQHYSQKILSVDTDRESGRMQIKCQNLNGVDIYYIDSDNGKLVKSHRA